MLKKNDQEPSGEDQGKDNSNLPVKRNEPSAPKKQTDGTSIQSVETADVPVSGQIDYYSEASMQSARPAPVKRLPLLIRGLLQIFLMSLIVAGALIATKRLIDAKPEIRKRPSFRTVYTISTTPVALGDHRPNFKVYGETVAARNVDLRSLVSGEVIWINDKLKAGARVPKGEALVEIDDFQFQGALREAAANREEVLARIRENRSRIDLEKAKLERLKEQFNLAESDHKRINDLRDKGTVTQKQLDDRTMVLSQRAQAVEQSEINLQAEDAKLEQQRASLARLVWRVEQAERNLKNTILKAPFDGIVRTTDVETGKTVNANDVVVSLYEDTQIEVRFTLTDNRYGRLQNDADGVLGRKVNVIWAIGNQQYIYPATIDRLGAEITSTSGGVEVFALMDQVNGNPDLRPGAFVEIQVPDANFTNSTTVPESAVYQGDTIYLKQEGKLVSRKVEVHAHDSGNVIISGKLNDGDAILTTRIAEISEGLRVREEGDPAQTKAPGDVAKKGKRNQNRQGN